VEKEMADYTLYALKRKYVGAAEEIKRVIYVSFYRNVH
jgi:hypothetical protein